MAVKVNEWTRQEEESQIEIEEDLRQEHLGNMTVMRELATFEQTSQWNLEH